jgi:hypothetical protein
MKSHFSLCAAAIAAWAFAVPSASAVVSIYGETATTGSNVTVNIYADLSTNTLVSFGVRLLYDTNNLRVIAAAKNAAVWYLSDGRTLYPYADPDTSTPGGVLILGAKFDGNNPLQGVTGQHVRLGTVTFSRLTPARPDFTLALGRPTAFDNFVTAGGSVLDTAVDGIVLGSVSTLQMLGVSRGPGGLYVQWQGGTQATQYLQRRFSLGPDGQWGDIFTNPPPTATTVTYTDPIGTNSTRFYRVRVQP